MLGSLLRRYSHQVWPDLRLRLLGLAVGLAAFLPGCQPNIENVIEGENGTIRLEEVAAILNDTSLDDAQRRQALRDLGITDEELIDGLIRGKGSFQATSGAA